MELVALSSSALSCRYFTLFRLQNDVLYKELRNILGTMFLESGKHAWVNHSSALSPRAGYPVDAFQLCAGTAIKQKFSPLLDLTVVC